jgi:hypothetical protein
VVDAIEETKAIDVAEELKDNFLGAYFWYLEGMEFAPGYKLSVESEAAADLFEALHDSVDAIPQDLITSTEQLYASLMPTDFEKVLGDSLTAVGRRSFPKNATEFLTALHAALVEGRLTTTAAQDRPWRSVKKRAHAASAIAGIRANPKPVIRSR